MLFNSLHFLVFFPIVLLINYILPKKIRYLWLLAASYYFYMCWNIKYSILILLSTVTTYLAALLINATKSIHVKKSVLAVSITVNLLILFFFKYFNFASNLLENLFQAIHITIHTPTVDVLLPVGISFYTFQAMSYNIDVLKKGGVEKNFFRYALFVSFFPQLVAGPIERSENLIAQLQYPHKFDFDKFREAFLLMTWGFFLKIVLADRIALFVDAVYADYLKYGGMYIVVATILFSIQIYCDFYGYSVIAKGAAKVLGIELMENFNAPYLAQSVSDFWRRWHMSLTLWFKDYIYIPLGGSRKGSVRKYYNKIIVFFVSGLWHGSRISFVAWGLLNGLYQVIGDILTPSRKKICSILKINTETIGHKLFKVSITYALICFSWIFFRATSFKIALEMIHSVLFIHNWRILFDGSLYMLGLDYKNFMLMIFCVAVLLFADIFRYKKISISSVVAKQNAVCRWIIVAFSICFILVFGIWGAGYDAAGFIYFQF